MNTEAKNIETDQEQNRDLRSKSDCSDLLSALNKMWTGQCGMMCQLPCTDRECREDMNNCEGGCPGADLADKMLGR